MEMKNNEMPEPIRLNDESVKSLSEARKWTNFFGVIGFIAVGFMIIAALIMVFVLPFLNQDSTTPFPMVFVGVVYLIFSAVYILPLLYLLRFGSNVRKALNAGDENLMGLALRNLALHFKSVGIILIVFMSIYIVFMLFMVILGIGMFSGMGNF